MGEGGGSGLSTGGVLAAFKLKQGSLQEVSEAGLAVASEGGLETMVLGRPAALSDMREVVPLLVADVPLLPSGKAIFSQMPAEWLDFTGRSDALGTRCFFAARRHEHSVFELVAPERLLRVPPVATEWQPALELRGDALDCAELADEAAWTVQLHPERAILRVLLRPGVLLREMLRRGTALPAARFAWRIIDASVESQADGGAGGARPKSATPIGEFSILSNVEDAAHTQPPHFTEHPLRREQLRSLGWMVSQEKRRKEPFVTELREVTPCPDAPHWRLEGSLRCEYTGVKGGVLADAIGYGKTACTIGLIDCTLKDALPQVPRPFAGFIPSRATLVLVPTNLHSQWLSEITKFTGQTFRVLSVPTCTQLKRLTVRDLARADVVVATYRLFYSAPYLRRLQEVAQTQQPKFAFPRLSGGGQQGGHSGGGTSSVHCTSAKTTAEWARAYRKAFEALPGWAAGLHDIAQDPVTPEKSPLQRQVLDDTTPAQVEPPVPQEAGGGGGAMRRCRKKSSTTLSAKEADGSSPSKGHKDVVDMAGQSLSAEPSASKKRRLKGKQATAQPVECVEAKATLAGSGNTQYVPLEAFWWRRVVCDEFHELLSRYPPAQVAVELFHGDYKWGLSGTPPCQTLAQIRKAAGFLGVQFPSATASGDSGGGDAPQKVAQDWLDAFVRRNTSELPPFEEEERIVPVRQTPKERALYLALTTQQSAEALRGAASQVASGGAEVVPAAAELAPLEEPPEIQAARQSASGLLKLCSHFSASGAIEVITAEDECERQLALRRERVRAVEREAKGIAERAVSTVRLIRHFEPHYCRTPSRADYGFLFNEPKATLAARLKFLGAPSSGTKPELLDRLLGPSGQHRGEGGGVASQAGERAREVALRVDFDPRAAGRARDSPEEAPPTWAALEADARAPDVSLSATPQAPAPPGTGRELVLRAVGAATAAMSSGSTAAPTRCTRLRSHLGMPRWPGSAGLAQSDLEQANWEWLADPANAQRLRKVVGAWKADVERSASQLVALEAEASARLDALGSFQQSLAASQAAPGAELEEPAPKFAKYGSKIEAIVKHVQKLQREDPGCKIICFVQWEDLKQKIGAALEEFGVGHLMLQGSVWARRTALTRFQFEASSPRMLLLSLEESASGTNLTAANHVIIVHPMEAATKEEAVAFEMQAVGRVRRPGQQRKIHIWRFVTMGTIEQQITEDHQRELWERQNAKISVSQPAPVDADSDAADEHDDEEEPPAATVAAPPCDEVFSTQRYITADSVAADAETLPAIFEDAETLPFQGAPFLGDAGGVNEATQQY